MKAVCFYKERDLRVEDVPAPVCEPGGILVKIEACAICGTDLKAYLKGDARIPAGQIIGHEFVGAVVEVGCDVRGFSAGERVTMATSISCGQCNWCRCGHQNRCSGLKPISRAYPGAFAEYMAVPPAGVAGGNVVKVPEILGDLAVLAEPLSCALNAQKLAGVKLGDTVVVIGFGPLGALHAQLARAHGAARVIITTLPGNRLTLAQTFDLDAIINVSTTDAVEEVMRLTDGSGADVIIATAPVVSAQEQAFRMVRKGGMVNLFAGLPQGNSELKIDSRLIHYREIFVSGASDSTPAHVATAVDLLAHGLISEQIITHRLSLDRFAEGIEIMKTESGLKVLMKPG